MRAGPDFSRARAHDLGGQPAGPVDWSAHETEPWHKLATALMYLLRDQCHLAKTDEMRRAIEDMSAADYRRLAYFDKWAGRSLDAGCGEGIDEPERDCAPRTRYKRPG